jgi:hypothetical protein
MLWCESERAGNAMVCTERMRVTTSPRQRPHVDKDEGESVR